MPVAWSQADTGGGHGGRRGCKPLSHFGGRGGEGVVDLGADGGEVAPILFPRLCQFGFQALPTCAGTSPGSHTRCRQMCWPAGVIACHVSYGRVCVRSGCSGGSSYSATGMARVYMLRFGVPPCQA